MQRALERREHEDSATRLAVDVPLLATLKLAVEDGRGATFGFVAHVRHVMVASAPSLFELPCGDRMCRDGGHDLSREILRALREGKEHFEGEHECDGSVGSEGGSRCGRLLRYVATATYVAAPVASLPANPSRSDGWGRSGG